MTTKCERNWLEVVVKSSASSASSGAPSTSGFEIVAHSVSETGPALRHWHISNRKVVAAQTDSALFSLQQKQLMAALL